MTQPHAATDNSPSEFVPGGFDSPTIEHVSAAQGTGKVSALTFDDGPNGKTTLRLLDFLKQRNILAVFCVIGENIAAADGRDVLRRIAADGHTLCNHTTSFADMGTWTIDEIRADLIENLRIIREALGDPRAAVPFFRAPNGSWGHTAEVAVSLGMQPLAVTGTIVDWEVSDVEILTENLREAMVPGQLVLVHDGFGDRDSSIDATMTVVDERLAEGWVFTLPVGTPAPGPVPAYPGSSAPRDARTTIS